MRQFFVCLSISLLIVILFVQLNDASYKKKKNKVVAYKSYYSKGGKKSDLYPASSYRHHHNHHNGHHAHGWLTMGAYSGSKGAFGWHSKHPVGGKKKKYG